MIAQVLAVVILIGAVVFILTMTALPVYLGIRLMLSGKRKR